MLTPSAIGVTELVTRIAAISRDQPLRYVSETNKSEIKILGVVLPYGPIIYARRQKGQHWRTCAPETISVDIISRVATQVQPHTAFSIDVILNSTGNNRSVFEAILAQLEEFYVCRPGKHVNGISGRRKFLYWNPDKPHPAGVVTETDDIRGVTTGLDPVSHQIPSHPADNFSKLRLHQQKQVKLFEVGAAKGWGIWIAENDQGIKVGRRAISSHPSAIRHLAKLPLFQGYPDAIKAARHLDVMFMRHDGFIPAIIEVEHTTGISSGLGRMNTFRHALEGVYASGGSGGTSFIICAEDGKAEEFMAKASSRQYAAIRPRFLPYSRLDIIWSLIRDNRQAGFSDSLFEAFSDPVRR